MTPEDKNDIAAAIAHVTRIALRRDGQGNAFAIADLLFAMCAVDTDQEKKVTLAEAGQYFSAMEFVQ